MGTLQQYGTQVRSRRATLKAAIKSGVVDLPELLEGAGDEALEEIALEIPVDQLLQAVDGIGPIAAAAIATDADVETKARLQYLTIQRRRALAAAIRQEMMPR